MLIRVALIVLCAAILMIVYSYQEARRNPVVRSATVVSPDFSSDQALKLLLLSDLHVRGAEIHSARLAQVVNLANSFQPDVVVLAGDYLSGGTRQVSPAEVASALRPLEALQARLGVFAILGNHDQEEAEAIEGALENMSIVLIQNKSVQVGPIGLGGVSTSFGSKSARRLQKAHGLRIMVSHSPDAFALAPPGVSLALAGHTHCGQIVLPILGALKTGSRFGERYRCGLIKERGKLLVVTSGIGTSHLPLRLGAPPDMWLLTIKGVVNGSRSGKFNDDSGTLQLDQRGM